jgi:hypothetical protein
MVSIFPLGGGGGGGWDMLLRGEIIAINVSVLKIWRDIMKSTLKITKRGNFKDSKWSRHKIKTFRGARDFLGPLNGTSDSEDHFGAKKVKGPSISRDVLTLQHPAVVFEVSNIPSNFKHHFWRGNCKINPVL